MEIQVSKLLVIWLSELWNVMEIVRKFVKRKQRKFSLKSIYEVGNYQFREEYFKSQRGSLVGKEFVLEV